MTQIKSKINIDNKKNVTKTRIARINTNHTKKTSVESKKTQMFTDDTDKKQIKH